MILVPINPLAEAGADANDGDLSLSVFFFCQLDRSPRRGGIRLAME